MFSLQQSFKPKDYWSGSVWRKMMLMADWTMGLTMGCKDLAILFTMVGRFSFRTVLRDSLLLQNWSNRAITSAESRVTKRSKSVSWLGSESVSTTAYPASFKSFKSTLEEERIYI
ncbi:hypothetical protein NQ315_016311 [Exocentrus adspersus]|uniref:Uncharacterized protein n=1 Tax=Exocentrus adspersus TaxID=1586481 RepID=A0AAV8VP37_9CUCU|nr:hypothetical protein NQ315_016311 [Exocentrus adspersus]